MFRLELGNLECMKNGKYYIKLTEIDNKLLMTKKDFNDLQENLAYINPEVIYNNNTHISNIDTYLLSYTIYHDYTINNKVIKLVEVTRLNDIILLKNNIEKQKYITENFHSNIYLKMYNQLISFEKYFKYNIIKFQSDSNKIQQYQTENQKLHKEINLKNNIISELQIKKKYYY